MAPAVQAGRNDCLLQAVDTPVGHTGDTADWHPEVDADIHRLHNLIDRQSLIVVLAVVAADWVAGPDRAFADAGQTLLQSMLTLPDDFAVSDRTCVFSEDVGL